MPQDGEVTEKGFGSKMTQELGAKEGLRGENTPAALSCHRRLGSVSETNPELILGSVPNHSLVFKLFCCYNISVLFLQNAVRKASSSGGALCVARDDDMVVLLCGRDARDAATPHPAPSSPLLKKHKFGTVYPRTRMERACKAVQVAW
jgi:hypothetical protein